MKMKYLMQNGYLKNNTEPFACNISVNTEDWTGKCASDVRKYFSNHYKNNIKTGTATVAVCGTGDYGGKATVSFKITSRKIKWWWE